MISNTRRFVLSFLNKQSYELALSEEMLADQCTGEMLLKSKDVGDIISYDALARYNQHIANVEAIQQIYGGIGDIYRLDDGEVFPRKVKTNTNILSEEVTIPVYNRLMISIDYDCYNIATKEISQNGNPDMTIEVSYTVNTESKEYSIPLSAHQENFIDIDVNSDITINSIVISQNNTNDNIRLVINSILLYVTR